MKFSARDRVNDVWNDQQSGREHARRAGGEPASKILRESKAKEPERRKHQRECGEGAGKVADPLAQGKMPRQEPKRDEDQDV